MKKENIIYLLFPIIWGFWAFFMHGHIGYWEDTNFFQFGSIYWENFAVKPGGWSEYIGHFLLQLYQWTWLGALIQTLLVAGVFAFTRSIIQKIGVLKNTLLFSSLPFLLIFALQTEQQVILGEMLKIFFFFFFLWGYLQLTHSLVRYWCFTLISPLAFLILGGVGTIAFYASIAIYEIWKNKGSTRIIFVLLWLLLIASQAFIWRRWVYTISIEEIYATFTAREYLLWMVYTSFLVLLCTSWLRREKQQSKDLFWKEFLLVTLLFVGCVYYFPNRTIERFCRMDQATIAGDWKEVLELAEQIDEHSREEMYLINLALSGQGKLGDRLLDYNAEWGTGGLYLPRDFDYKTCALGGEFYYRLKIPNEAIHWTFQASIASPQGMDFRTLKRLIELNILKRDTIIADKYLTILENTLGYSNWCAERRKELSDPLSEQILPTTNRDFFIGSRPFVSDLARVLDAGKSKDMTLDYILCHLLLKKDLPKFCQLLEMFYSSNKENIPKAYQEAILVAMTSNKSALKKRYTIDPQINKSFSNYNALFRNASKNKQQAKELMKAFKDTWWYYSHFVEPRKINERGQISSYSL